MRPLTNSLLIKPGEEIIFEPQSYHVMFYKFNIKVKPEQMIKANLNFNNNLLIPIEFKVIKNNISHKHH